MLPKTFDWPAQYAGDTASTVNLIILDGEVPVDISGSLIEMQVRPASGKAPVLELSTADGLSIAITDGPNGMFRVGLHQNPETAGAFIYDIQVTFVTGRVQTYFRGSYLIEDDVTR